MEAILFDSHCHLTDPRLLDQLDAVMARARAAGVVGAITVGCGPDDGERAIELAGQFEQVHAAVAIHPHDAKHFSPQALERIAGLLARPKVVALGEIGLDYHYDFAPREAQRSAFEAQLRLAVERRLPVIVHCRQAVDDALAILRHAAGGAFRGVFHCFTGTADEARRILDAGGSISLSGAVTFRKSGELAEVARLVPADRLLIETDAPYLSPEPVRKQKVNEPANLVHTLRAVAAFRGTDAAALADRLRLNVRDLFGIDAR